MIRALASQATVAVRNAQFEEVARGRAALRFVASLATAMAHEINNPLQVIKSHIQLLARGVSDPVLGQRIDAVLGAVDAIHEIVERMNRITELKLADQSRVEEWWSRYVAAPLPKNTVSK